MIIQQGQLRWLGYVARMGEERLVRKVYEVKGDEERRGESQDEHGKK